MPAIMNGHWNLRTVSLFAAILLAGFHTADGQRQAHAAPRGPLIESRFYAGLAEAAARAEKKNTRKSGGGGGGRFVEFRPEGGLLVGFDVWEGNWSGHVVIRGLRPIFQTANGRVRGRDHGNTEGAPARSIEAKEGYAVAALHARGGERLDGFQVLFWKVRPSMGRLDAEGAYRSDWVGGQGGGKTRSPLSSDGRPVLGVSGASGAEIDRLGLIYAEIN